jgi:hypothetical protein
VTKLLLLVHFAATWYLVGLCWLVQRVQYPLMDRVGVAGYPAYEQAHVSRIGPVVAPMMLIELASGIWLLLIAPTGELRLLYGVGLALLVAVWLSTFLLQVPLHGTLVDGFDASAHAALVRTNWIRTLAWTARGALLVWLLWRLVRLEPA